MAERPEIGTEVRAALDKARAKLGVAQRLQASGDYEDCVSRAYYAVYHAAEAALAVEGLRAGSHEGLKTQFGLHLVTKGLVPRELGKTLRKLKDQRENGDYSLYSAIDLDDAREAVLLAQQFIDAIEKFIRSRGLLSP